MKYTAIALSLTLILASSLLDARKQSRLILMAMARSISLTFWRLLKGLASPPVRMILMKNSISMAMAQSIFRIFCFLSMLLAGLQVRRHLHLQNPRPGFFILAI